MIKIQFISVKTLKEKSVIQDNVGEKNLNIAIQEFQEFDLKPFLGRAEYLRLEAELLKVSRGELTELEDDDKIKMEYITPIMIYGSLLYSIPAVHTKFTDKGIQEDKDINADRASKQDARADHAFKLDACKSAFLEYKNDLTNIVKSCGEAHDTTSTFTGMFLPDVTVDYDELYKDTYYKSKGGFKVVR